MAKFFGSWKISSFDNVGAAELLPIACGWVIATALEKIPSDPAISFLGIQPRKTVAHVHLETCKNPL